MLHPGDLILWYLSYMFVYRAAFVREVLYAGHLYMLVIPV